MSDVTLRNVRGEFRPMGTLRGNPGDGRRDLTLENCDLKLADETLALGPTENFVVKNVTVNGKPFILSRASAPSATYSMEWPSRVRAMRATSRRSRRSSA